MQWWAFLYGYFTEEMENISENCFSRIIIWKWNYCTVLKGMFILVFNRHCQNSTPEQKTRLYSHEVCINIHFTTNLPRFLISTNLMGKKIIPYCIYLNCPDNELG